jgi:opacity protein-like surface antigen
MIGVLSATPLRASDRQDAPSGFAFHSPKIFFGGHAGVNFPEAKGDIFGVATRDLTLERNDFRAPVYGLDFGVYVRSHFAVVASLDYARATVNSEYRHFIEDNGNPIVQTTRLSQLELLGILRYYPRKTGEAIGNYSWIPTRILPYVGAGGGYVKYKFSQSGDFVDHSTYDIYTDLLTTGNPAFLMQASAGLDIVLSNRIVANVEGRYSWASGNISRGRMSYQPDFSFPSVDLDGFKTIGGLYFRF